MNPTLSFYTNMPTPYQLDFFDELSKLFRLHVIYFTEIEKDRQWVFNRQISAYKQKTLSNNIIARIVQKKVISFHFSWSIFSCCLKDKSDYIIINGTYWSPNVVIAILICFLKRKKVFFYAEPVFETKSRFNFWIKRNILMIPVRFFTDGIFAVGKLGIESYRHYGYKKPIYNVPYNINTDLFSDTHLDPIKKKNYLLKWKPAGETVLLASGALVKRKGVDVVIKAFMTISSETNVRLLIIGDGPEKDSLIRLASTSSRIHFLGFQQKEDVPYFFKIADIFVFGSHYDGWGLVINEAIASDLPIICSDRVGAATDKLVDNYNAFICKDGDVNCFAEKMKELISYPDLREQMINYNRVIKEELSSPFNAKKLYAFLTNYK